MFTLLTTFHHAGGTRRDLFLVNPISLSLSSYNNSNQDQDKVNDEVRMARRLV
jgi:hypothetical protein